MGWGGGWSNQLLRHSQLGVRLSWAVTTYPQILANGIWSWFLVSFEVNRVEACFANNLGSKEAYFGSGSSIVLG